MAEEYKFNNEEKELARRITELNGMVSRLEFIYEDSKKFVYKQLAETAKRLDEIENPDVHFKVVRR